jgi:hypothetical protein
MTLTAHLLFRQRTCPEFYDLRETETQISVYSLTVIAVSVELLFVRSVFVTLKK